MTRNFVFNIIKFLTLDYYFSRKNNNTILVLMFHQVNDKKTPFYPAMPVNTFRELCRFIKRHYNVIHLSEAQTYFQENINKPAAVISFDDGHKDIIENALPILSELDLKFNININTEILETGKPQDFVQIYDILNATSITSYFHPAYMKEPININRAVPISTENEFTNLLSGLTQAQRKDLITDLALKAAMPENAYSEMLNIHDIQLLSQMNVEIGAHSHTHSILTLIPKDQLVFELNHSKQILETIIQKKVEIFAYPNGVYNAEIEALARESGYKILLRTEDKINVIRSCEALPDSFYRVNQYHATLSEALAHTYGATKIIRKIIN